MARLLGRWLVCAVVATCMAGGGMMVTPGVASAAGAFQTTLPFSGLHDPQGLAVDGNGNVFLVDHLNYRVLELPNGGSQASLPFSGLTAPFGVGVDADDDVFVADAGVGQVVAVPNGGTQVLKANLDSPTGLAADANGDVFVADILMGEVVELTHSGTQVTLPFTGLSTPDGVAVDGQGDVFVTDQINNQVVELRSSGGQVTLPFTGLNNPAGVAVDAGGDVFVSDFGNNRVVELPNGGSQVTLPFTGLSGPTGVAVDERGDVFVSDSGNNRVVLGVAPVSVPPAPVAVTAVGGDGSAQVSWVPFTTPGSGVTSYTVTPMVNGVAQPYTIFESTASTVTVRGLTNGLPYRFEVAANNAMGTGPASALSPVVISPFSSPASFVQRQYQDFVGSPPPSSVVSSEVNALNAGADPASYAFDLRRSPDASTNVDPVTRQYFASFRRIPDAHGLTYWIGQRRLGKSVFAISDSFASSPEFKDTYGSLSNSAFVNLVYKNVLNRTPDATGSTYWDTQLDAHKATRGQVMVGFTQSNEYKVAKQPSVDAAVTWIDMLGASPSQSDFATWVTKLTTGGKTVTDLARAIMAMPAYAARVG